VGKGDSTMAIAPHRIDLFVHEIGPLTSTNNVKPSRRSSVWKNRVKKMSYIARLNIDLKLKVLFQ
jgi:hypothetical protein